MIDIFIRVANQLHPYETLLAIAERMGSSSKAGMVQEMQVKILFGSSSSIMSYMIFLQHVIRGRKRFTAATALLKEQVILFLTKKRRIHYLGNFLKEIVGME